MLQLIFLLTYPLLISAGASFLTWRALSRPRTFFTLATAALYALYVACFYLLAPTSVGYTLVAAEPGQPKYEEPLFALIEPYYKTLGAFTAMAVLATVALLRTFKR